eukprot:6062635-Amphidinium_carterae.1
MVSQSSESVLDTRFARISESANLDRCNTLITACTAGLPGPQLAGRAGSSALAWRRWADRPTMRGGQSLRVSDTST